MISHQYKCVFIHIPGTAGTTIENCFLGKDQWFINFFEKHCPLSMLMEFPHNFYYKFDEYFKFSIVRHPYERMRSLWRFKDGYGFYLNDKGEMEIDKCFDENSDFNIEQLPKNTLMSYYGIKLEYVPQFHIHKKNALYLNHLDAPMNRIYKFENLEECFDELSEKFLIPREKFNKKYEYSINKPHLSKKSKDILRRIQKLDFEFFNYDPDI
jgi:hypothetical protein